MSKRHYITIYLLGGLGIWLAMTDNLIISIFILLLMIGTIAWPIAKYFERQRRLKDPFVVYCEDRMEQLKDYVVFEPLGEEKYIKLTLEFLTDVDVRFIGLKFLLNEGSSGSISITDLDDWQFPVHGDRPPNVYPPHSINDGTWFWEYIDTNLRSLKQRITIGIRCRAIPNARGRLEVALTAKEVGKDLYLPFEVTGNDR